MGGFKVIEGEGEEKYPIVWKCFDCGQTDKGFYDVRSYDGDWDVYCNECQSSNTAEQNEGFRSEDCPICYAKTVEQVKADDECELCEGYASIYPYQLYQWEEEQKKI